VRLFAVDCEAEVEKIAGRRPAPRFCRILCDGSGAEWPLSRKFGCVPEMAPRVLEHAHALGLAAMACRSMSARSSAIRGCGRRAGVRVGHFPRTRGARHSVADGQPRRRLSDQYLNNVPAVKTYGNVIFRALSKHFGNRIPRRSSNGRGMVGNAGVIEAEVVLISKKSQDDTLRWSISTSANSTASPRPPTK